ncbi:hypothetical protein DFR76_110241 [Nocardia pseudobrasiliensis]|uniref:Uncharacterized protein n=1 Tax=Nocardia pseudobrasiliensis TaxID=45979 RepID=A0A370I2M3_9NOCA|nr:hypothetical protein DFR76_110241 [Nocardia pseudobrasiliensis]
MRVVVCVGGSGTGVSRYLERQGLPHVHNACHCG